MYVWNLRNKLGPEIQAWELFVQISFKIKSLVNYTSLKSKNKLRTQERKKNLGEYLSFKKRKRERNAQGSWKSNSFKWLGSQERKRFQESGDGSCFKCYRVQKGANWEKAVRLRTAFPWNYLRNWVRMLVFSLFKYHKIKGFGYLFS